MSQQNLGWQEDALKAKRRPNNHVCHRPVTHPDAAQPQQVKLRDDAQAVETQVPDGDQTRSFAVYCIMGGGVQAAQTANRLLYNRPEGYSMRDWADGTLTFAGLTQPEANGLRRNSREMQKAIHGYKGKILKALDKQLKCMSWWQLVEEEIMSFKGASLFLLHTRERTDNVVLDLEMLAWAKHAHQGMSAGNVPGDTPKDAHEYVAVEALVRRIQRYTWPWASALQADSMIRKPKV